MTFICIVRPLRTKSVRKQVPDPQQISKIMKTQLECSSKYTSITTQSDEMAAKVLIQIRLISFHQHAKKKKNRIDK